MKLSAKIRLAMRVTRMRGYDTIFFVVQANGCWAKEVIQNIFIERIIFTETKDSLRNVELFFSVNL